MPRVVNEATGGPSFRSLRRLLQLGPEVGGELQWLFPMPPRAMCPIDEVGDLSKCRCGTGEPHRPLWLALNESLHILLHRRVLKCSNRSEFCRLTDFVVSIGSDEIAIKFSKAVAELLRHLLGLNASVK